MINKRIVVAYEGVPYPDGRIIVEGAIKMEDDRVPVKILGDMLHRVVGYASDLKRQDDVVTMLVEVESTLIDLHTVTASAYLQPIDVEDHESSLIVTDGRLRVIYLSEMRPVPLKEQIVDPDEHAAWMEHAGDGCRDELPMTEERIREIVRDEIAQDIIRRNKEAFEKEMDHEGIKKSVETDLQKLPWWKHYCSHFQKGEVLLSYIRICPYCHTVQPDKEADIG